MYESTKIVSRSRKRLVIHMESQNVKNWALKNGKNDIMFRLQHGASVDMKQTVSAQLNVKNWALENGKNDIMFHLCLYALHY